jgi:hypothetical protein
MPPDITKPSCSLARQTYGGDMAHQDDAEAIIKALNLIAEVIPDYGFPTAAEMRALVRYARVPDACIRATVVAVTGSPRLAQSAVLDAEDALDTIEFANAYEFVARKFETMARGVRYAIARRRARTGLQVLTAFAMAKRLLKTHPELMRDVKTVRKHLAKKQRRFPGKRRRKKA